MEKHAQMLLFIFGVFMTSVHTQGWNNVPVEMGQDILLNCSLDQNMIIWYMQLLEGSPVRILKTYTKRTVDADYYNDTFKNKYSVKLGNSLCIRKGTLEDLRFYYCTTIGNNSSPFLNETYLVSVPVPAKDCSGNFYFWLLMFVSLILITVLAGFYLSARCRNKPNHPVTPGISTTQLNHIYDGIRESGRNSMQDETSSHVGAAVSEPLIPPGGFLSDSGCVYSKTQLPVPTAPVQ